MSHSSPMPVLPELSQDLPNGPLKQGSIMQVPAVLIVTMGCMVGLTACDRPVESDLATPIEQTAVENLTASPPADQPAAAAPEFESTAPSNAANFYTEGLDRASSASSISQSAQSPEDWQLAAGRWQQAIDLMKSVPTSSTHRALAEEKIKEYQGNLTVAQQQVQRLETAAADPSPTIVSASGNSRSSQSVPQTASQGNAQATPPASTSPANSQQTARVESGVTYQVPIRRRSGGTPVIEVLLNGRPVEMIVDTGASGTVITQTVANALAVKPVGQASVNTASAKDVSFDIGYIDSIEVNGAVLREVPVAIGPDLEIGLLGNDFFGRYDVTIREKMVEFRER